MPLSATQRVTVSERRTKAVRLAASGMDYTQIAQRLGYHYRSGAFKAIRGALAAQQAEAVDELRALEIERLDALQRSCWDSAIAGDIPAVDRCLKVIAARVRLLGLDQHTDKAVSAGGTVVSMSWRPDSAQLGSSSATGRENNSAASVRPVQVPSDFTFPVR